MSITVELFEAFGPLKSVELADQMNWKSISASDSSYPYWMHPIKRPDSEDSILYKCSYVKYIFGKITGTYSKAKRVRWVIDGIPGLNTKLYYKMTNLYVSPTENLMSTGTLINSSITLFPCLSTTGPDNATSFIMNLSPNTTYYTNYLVTQLYVKRGPWTQVGNTAQLIQTDENPEGEPDMKIKLLVDDYE